jgi:hypothetical protein
MQSSPRTTQQKICIPLSSGLDLKIASQPEDQNGYATSTLPKGFLLFSNGLDLAEEAVGFGFPVLKCGLQTLFPGRIELAVEQHGSIWSVESAFSMNLEEKIHHPGMGIIKNGQVYAIKNFLAALIRNITPLRGLLTAVSSGLRRVFGWKTIYQEAGFHATIRTIHTFNMETGKISVEVDLVDLPAGITEVVVMNEQGARSFDRYQDSNGISLHQEKVGCWDEVTAEKASFISTSSKVTFRLRQVKGARLFRGREMVGSRLAWAGFGFSFPPSIKKLIYELEIESLA